MNWDAIGALGEILGAMAVIGSLLFVGVQIRSNTRATQIATTHNLTDIFLTVAAKISEDPEMARIWAQQSRDISVLSASDLQRLVPLNVMVLRSFEDVFHHHQAGQMSDEMWEGWQAFILTICSYHGVRSIWESRKYYYSRSFQAFLDNPPPLDTIPTVADYIDSVTEHGEI